jgi:predicted anti-sigma-YlaC factor YlaD
MLIAGGLAAARLFAVVLSLLALTGCSIRQYALNQTADALSRSGSSFASDDDPDLIRDAAPFSLKLMESVLAENPQHRELLTAAARGFTQYAFAYVQQIGEELEDVDLARATQQLRRARALYARARDYGLRGLEVSHPGFATGLQRDASAAVSTARREDVPLLYWTAASWGSLISLSKEDPQIVAQVPMMEALIDRALELDESWDAGAIHAFLISYELVRPKRKGDPVVVARAHFQRAVELSRGQQAGPFVALAESVDVSLQDRVAFDADLKRALAIDVDAHPQWRLANLVMQRRARWLLTRTEQLIAE